jgi:hypothetical protein
MGWPERSSLQGAGGAAGDPRWRLWRQIELELLDQEAEFWLGLGVTRQQQFPPVGCRQIERLRKAQELKHTLRPRGPTLGM